MTYLLYRYFKRVKFYKKCSCISQMHTKSLENKRRAPAIKLEDKYSRILVEDPNLNPENAFVYRVEENYEKNTIFSLALPPPNITGSLHLGHALTTTLQDVLCRFMRLNGQNVCWLPGFDHAGIATQVVVEKYLAKQNLNRHELGYENFISEVHKWKRKNQHKIKDQLKSLGASLDWSKEVFTMDPEQTKAVKEAFIRLFDSGLIYRTNDLVNWSCHLNSSISDIEIENVEIEKPTPISVPGYSRPIKFGLIYNIAYKTSDDSDEIVIATTRPETLLGDVAVAVHPGDVRYEHLIGRTLKHPFLNKNIPVIGDEHVDMTFGTGALKITPAHDRDDLALGKKHGLDLNVSVINEKGCIEDGLSIFSGMKRYDAREKILNELQIMQLLRHVNTHKMVLPVCSRSGDVIELLLRPQWYIKCKEMYRESIGAIKNGDLKLIPDDYERIWLEWLDENKDWCISRQLWWGHRIPAYECWSEENPDKTVWVAASDTEDAKIRSSKTLNTAPSMIVCKQDSDVLDTWFSSAIYPFSSHGWPNSTAQYEQLYPLSIMVTGHDITFFWVCRMVMLGTRLTGKLPFSKILLHGIVCDAKGQKMSKSRGNVLEPQDVINGTSLQRLNDGTRSLYDNGILTEDELINTLKERKKSFPNGIPECGADALRFTLCGEDVKSARINFDANECYKNAKFCNKIWQSLRFARNITESVDGGVLNSYKSTDLTYMDRWLLSKLSATVQSVCDSIEEYDFHVATSSLKRFLYRNLCDVYVEYAKMDLRPVLMEYRTAGHCHTLSVAYNTALRLLSPFMPFLSRKLIDHIPLEYNCIFNFDDTPDNLSIADKEPLMSWKDARLEEDVDEALKIVTAVRHIKAIYRIKKSDRSSIYLQNCNNDASFTEVCKDLILHLSSCEDLKWIDRNDALDLKTWTYTSDSSTKVYLDAASDSVSLASGEDSCRKLEKMKKTLEKLEKEYSNERFKRAPMDVQTSHRVKISALKDQIQKITGELSNNQC